MTNNQWLVLLLVIPILVVIFAIAAEKRGIKRELRGQRKPSIRTRLFLLAFAAMAFALVFCVRAIVR